MAYVKYPNSKQFLKELKNDKLDKIYLFLGEESGEKDKYINIILNKIFKDEDNKKNSIGNFHLENEEILPAADFALSQSMFSTDKVCILRNVDGIKSSKKNEILVSDVLSNVPRSTTLIMTSSSNFPPAIVPKEFLSGIKIVQFWRYFDNDIFNYIRMNLNNLGITIDERSIRLLVELTGNDIKNIDDALSMIKYSGLSGNVSGKEIKNLISDVRDISIFDFLDLFFKKNKNSLKLLKKLLDDGASELFILNMILKETEKIEKCHYLIQNGNSYDDAFKKSGINKRNVNKFQEYLSLHSPEKLRKIFNLIGITDYKIKSHRSSKSLVSNPVFEMVSEVLFLK